MNIPASSGMLRISDVLKATWVTRRAIRFYEQQGLLMPAGRDQYGRRLYSKADVMRLRLIRVLRSAGLSLASIREVLDSRVVYPEDSSPGEWIDRLTDVLTRHSEALSRQLEAVRGAEQEMRSAVDWIRRHREALQDKPDKVAKNSGAPLIVRALVCQPSDQPTIRPYVSPLRHRRAEEAGDEDGLPAMPALLPW